jgi:pectin methylesterase-like acyl-CoA thioesterase
MSRIRTLSVAALVMALAVAASSARAADDKKSDSTAIHGAVTAISMEKDSKDATVIGTFTIKPGKKAKDPAETTFKVTADTKFVKGAHKKKGSTTTTAADEKADSTPPTFADLKEKDHVAVEADKDGKALSVTISSPKKPAA